MSFHRRSTVGVLLAVFACLAWAAVAGAAEPAKPAPAAKPAAVAAPAAQAAPMGKISDLWFFWPKEGHAAEFEAAVKAHLAWRKQAGEAFAWECYQPTVGDDLAYYVFRSGDHQWAEFDTEQAWSMKSKADAEFDKSVLPHVARYEHQMTESDFDHTLWHDNPNYKYFWVESRQLAPGGYEGVMAAVDKVHKALVAAKWPKSYGFDWVIGGDGGLLLVLPFTNYADMADPEPPMMKVVAAQLGSEKDAREVFHQFDEGVASTKTTIYLLRTDLSTQK